jgi:hypothetical protein
MRKQKEVFDAGAIEAKMEERNALHARFYNKIAWGRAGILPLMPWAFLINEGFT